MPAAELAPDVRNRVRSERRPAEARRPARPTASGRPAVERFGSTRVGSRHHGLAVALVVLAAIVAVVVLAVA